MLCFAHLTASCTALVQHVTTTDKEVDLENSTMEACSSDICEWLEALPPRPPTTDRLPSTRHKQRWVVWSGARVLIALAMIASLGLILLLVDLRSTHIGLSSFQFQNSYHMEFAEVGGVRMWCWLLFEWLDLIKLGPSHNVQSHPPHSGASGRCGQ